MHMHECTSMCMQPYLLMQTNDNTGFAVPHMHCMCLLPLPAAAAAAAAAA
jgi:hypothetical protein